MSMYLANTFIDIAAKQRNTDGTRVMAIHESFRLRIQLRT